MIWLTWRQHRVALFWLIGAAAALLVGMLAMGLVISAKAHEVHGVAVGVASPWLRYIVPGLLAYPLVGGLFLGANVVPREVQDQTMPFSLGQDVSPRRWLLSKMGFLGACTLASSILMGMAGWVWTAWIRTYDPAQSTWDAFDVMGLAPAAYALFALAVGLLAGVALRKQVGAMALTAVVFVAVRLGIYVARGHLVAPDEQTLPAATALEPVGALRVAYQIVDRAGRPIADWAFGVPPDSLFARVSYQPAERYWTIHALEVGIFVAGALIALTVALLVLSRIVRRGA